MAGGLIVNLRRLRWAWRRATASIALGMAAMTASIVLGVAASDCVEVVGVAASDCVEVVVETSADGDGRRNEAELARHAPFRWKWVRGNRSIMV